MRLRRVVKVTPTQVILDNGDHHKIDTGSRIGGLGDSILRLAANLFSAAFRPTVFAPSSNQPGYFNLEFYNVPEEDIRNLAELLKSFAQG